jgi:DUF2924 family protein
MNGDFGYLPMASKAMGRRTGANGCLNILTGFGFQPEQCVCLPVQEGGQQMKRKVSLRDSSVTAEIAALPTATYAELKQRWRLLYRTEPPRRISRDLLVRALAYRIQEKALGGLKPSTRRLLVKVAIDAAAQRPLQLAPRPTLKPGTVLLREWHGTQHQVIVRNDGIVFRGKPYRSLSEVAYRITGTKWSGPRFFGLTPNHQEHKSDGTA